MIANIVIALILIALVSLCVGYIVHTLRQGKKEGVGAACLGCSAYKNGTCKSHCAPVESAIAHPCEASV